MIYGSNPNLPIKYGASYKSNTPLAAVTPEAVFTPAANVRGAIVWLASYMTQNAAGTGAYNKAGYLAKTSAPTTSVDGDLIVTADWAAYNNGFGGKLEKPVFIAAGKGFYFISEPAETGAIRKVLYDLL